MSESLKARFAQPEVREKLRKAQQARRRRERDQFVAQPDTKRCAKCGDSKPVGEFYSKRRKLKSGGELIYPDSRCKECRKQGSREAYARAVEKFGSAEVARRRRAKEDPRRRREYKREYSTLRRRKKGVQPRNFSKSRTEGKRDGLPSHPLAVLLREEVEGRGFEAVAAAMGVAERRLTALLNEEHPTVTLATVDRALHGLGRPEDLHFLYPADKPKPIGYVYLDPEGNPLNGAP